MFEGRAKTKKGLMRGKTRIGGRDLGEGEFFKESTGGRRKTDVKREGNSRPLRKTGEGKGW